MWDNPRGQLPETGIRSEAENLYRGNLLEVQLKEWVEPVQEV